MANEFVAKNGLISQNNSIVTGSLTVTNGITGSLFGTASNLQGGTDSYIAKWNGSTQLTASVIYENAAQIGIGTTTLYQKLTVDGGGYFTSDLITLGKLSNGSNPIAVSSYTHAEGEGTTAGQLWYYLSFSSGLVNIVLDPGVDFSSDFGKYLNIEGTLYEIQSVTYTPSEIGFAGTVSIQLVDASVNGTLYFTSTTTPTPYNASETFPSALASHVEGRKTITYGDYSHAEGSGSLAVGDASHAEGLGTIAYGDFQHVEGAYNIPLTDPNAFIIGNGTSDLNRSNLIFASGSQVQITGSLIVSGSSTFTNIGPAIFSGSVTSTAGFTGSFSGTITSASFATTAQTASFVTASNVIGTVLSSSNRSRNKYINNFHRSVRNRRCDN